jgi:hypothetical protein
MKRLSLILAFLFYATISYAQSYEVNIQAVANKKIRDDGGKLVLLPDETFTIREIEVLNDHLSTGGEPIIRWILVKSILLPLALII